MPARNVRRPGVPNASFTLSSPKMRQLRSAQTSTRSMLTSVTLALRKVALRLEESDNLWMRLIERESHLAALREYAKEAARGQGRLVLISGEAGVGKSVLLEEFAQETQGARWLWAGCDGLFTPAAL